MDELQNGDLSCPTKANVRGLPCLTISLFKTAYFPCWKVMVMPLSGQTLGSVIELDEADSLII